MSKFHIVHDRKQIQLKQDDVKKCKSVADLKALLHLEKGFEINNMVLSCDNLLLTDSLKIDGVLINSGGPDTGDGRNNS